MTHKAIATPSRTNEILDRYGLAAKKSLGQNFMMEPQILRDMVALAGIDQNTNVIEIGPGIGALTEFLLRRAQGVLAYELDDRLIPVLEQELGQYPNFYLKHEDILAANLKEDMGQLPDSEQLVVCANLPYYITTPILFHLLASELLIDRFALLMQKEVAERLSAKPGTKAYGSLTIAIDYYCTSRIALKVPRTVFKPRPRVDSCVLLLERREEPPIHLHDEGQFQALLRAAFSKRRKTLWNNLRMALGEVGDLEMALAAAGISPNVRAERLTIQEFGALSNALLEKGLLFSKAQANQETSNINQADQGTSNEN